MTLIHVSGPVNLPVSVAEAKMHTRIDHGAEDWIVETYIRSALEEIERRTGIVYMPQTWQWIGDAFPSEDAIDLGIGPVTAVTSVVYYDEDSVSQTLDAAEYLVDTASTLGRVVRVGSTWPSSATRHDAVTVEFTAGRDNVPSSIQHAIMVHAAQSYEDRSGEREPFGMAVTSLVGAHRRIVF